MARTSGAVRFEVTSNDLNDLYRSIRKADPVFAAAIRKSVKLAAAPVLSAVKTAAHEQGLNRAAAATTVRFSSTAKQMTATIATNLKKAPYARALEYGSQHSSGTVNRHPVFADPRQSRDQWTWVEQPMRPYFWAAVRESSNASKSLILRQLRQALAEARIAPYS